MEVRVIDEDLLILVSSEAILTAFLEVIQLDICNKSIACVTCCLTS